VAVSRDKCIRDSTANDQGINLVGKGIKDGELGRDLGATNNSDKRTCRIVERLRQCVELSRQQRTGTRYRCVFTNPVGACLGTMRRAKSIHDKYIAERCHLLGELIITFLFANEEANVFEQDNIAWLDINTIDPVLNPRNLAIQQMANVVRYGL